MRGDRGDPGARPGVRLGRRRHVGRGRRTSRDRGPGHAAARRLSMTPRRSIELGAVILGLAVLARLANRFGIPSIPLYLLAGLAFGEGGLLPLGATSEFVETGSEIGLILLLFLVGLEYSASELIGRPARLDPCGAVEPRADVPAGGDRRAAPGLGRDPGAVPGRHHVRDVLGRDGEDPERPGLDREPRDAAGPVDHDPGGPGDGRVPPDPGRVPDRWIRADRGIGRPLSRSAWSRRSWRSR